MKIEYSMRCTQRERLLMDTNRLRFVFFSPSLSTSRFTWNFNPVSKDGPLNIPGYPTTTTREREAAHFKILRRISSGICIQWEQRRNYGSLLIAFRLYAVEMLIFVGWFFLVCQQTRCSSVDGVGWVGFLVWANLWR